jgi:uncharacterized protein (DUF58 family)
MLRRFWLNRLTPSDSLTLTQRNVYILPTPAGWMLALTLLVLLICSINYQLNLGYLLTFMLAGSAVVAMHMCHGTLRGLTLHLQPPPAQFAGSRVQIDIHLHNPRRSVRYGIGLSPWGAGQWNWTDVPALGSARVQVAVLLERRGLQKLPALTAETRFPMGTFRVWTVWQPSAQVLVYPRAETHAPPLPPGEPSAAEASAAQRHDNGEFDGVRPYRRGDSRKMVVWKKAAKTDNLVSRDAQQAQGRELWLDLHHTGLPAGTEVGLEQKLSRLCAWVLAADRADLHYGLRLGATAIAPGSGSVHRQECLRSLALF